MVESAGVTGASAANISHTCLQLEPAQRGAKPPNGVDLLYAQPAAEPIESADAAGDDSTCRVVQPSVSRLKWTLLYFRLLFSQ